MSKFTHSNRETSHQFLQDIGCIYNKDFDISGLMKPILDVLGDEIGKWVLSVGAGLLTGGAGGPVVFGLIQGASKVAEGEAESLAKKFANVGAEKWDDMNEKDRIYTKLEIMRLLHEGVNGPDLISGKPVYNYLASSQLSDGKKKRLSARVLALNTYICNHKADAYPAGDNLRDSSGIRYVYPDITRTDPTEFIQKLSYELAVYDHSENGSVRIDKDSKTLNKWKNAIAYFAENASADGVTKQRTKKETQEQVKSAGLGAMALFGIGFLK